MERERIERSLSARGIQPSAQRFAVAEYVLDTRDHPSADRVFEEVRARIPMISRATVYNTLNLFVRRGLLKPLVLAEGKVVFDPNVDPHHHFIDEESGAIHDVPWDALEVRNLDALRGVRVKEYQVVLRGAWRARTRRARRGSGRV
jgi:Fur family transcriptional regulator, iron response regulator